jgi:hypothetical protein
MENGNKLEFPEGQEGVRGNQGFPLADKLYLEKRFNIILIYISNGTALE